MQEEVFDFLGRHTSLIITTHENPDADGLGAELAFAQICRDLGKKVSILNSGPKAERFDFMDPQGEIRVWDRENGTENAENSALVILDSPDEFYIGAIKDLIPLTREVFVIDHHEPAPITTLKGYRDNTASSTCELIMELAAGAKITLNEISSNALYAGISSDTGSFAYSKTTARTFSAVLKLVEGGVNPYAIYRELNESDPLSSLLLSKQVFSTLEILKRGKVAIQILRKEDLAAAKAQIEDAEAFVNVPLKASTIAVSVLIKENPNGQIRCSLRSKGEINVSKIAQAFGGGGHVSAAGFKSSFNIEETRKLLLGTITKALEQIP